MSTELKTVAQALYEVLSREEFEKVVANHDPDFCDVELTGVSTNPGDALAGVFAWSGSPEEFEYWNIMYTRIGGEV